MGVGVIERVSRRRHRSDDGVTLDVVGAETSEPYIRICDADGLFLGAFDREQMALMSVDLLTALRPT